MTEPTSHELDAQDLERFMRLFGPPGPERVRIVEKLDAARELLGDAAYDRVFRSAMDSIEAKVEWRLRSGLPRAKRAAGTVTTNPGGRAE